MKVISHRGYWLAREERNSKSAFTRSFEAGLGVETDIRDDGQGNIVISHDPSMGGELSLVEFMQLASQFDLRTPIALNIKADGLVEGLTTIMKSHPNLDYFVFDMSFPDSRGYFDSEIPLYYRLSEFEELPPIQAQGVWIDSFDYDWFDVGVVEKLLAKNSVCIVSPELHGREHKAQWEMLRDIASHPGLSLCTDFPLEASQFFGDGKAS